MRQTKEGCYLGDLVFQRDLQYNAPTIASLVESVLKLLKLYQEAGFQVTEICTNHEFKPVLKVPQDNGWSFMPNLANVQEHVPEAK